MALDIGDNELVATIEDIQNELPPEHLLDTVLIPHPSARLVQSSFPAGSIWNATKAKP